MEGEQEQSRPEFSASELQKLRSLKRKVERDEIGGPHDRPEEDREFAMHELPEGGESDLAWRNLSPDLREKFYALFGRDIEPQGREKLEGEQQGIFEGETTLGGYVQKIFLKAPRYLEVLKSFQGEKKYGPGFHSIALRGLAIEQLFRVLEKEYPEFGASVKDEIPEGFASSIFVSTWIDPVRKADVAHRVEQILSGHPILKMLDMQPYQHKEMGVLGKHLEEQGTLPVGATERLIARMYKNSIEHLRASVAENPERERKIQGYERKLAALGVEPYSDSETQRIILEMALIPEFGPPTQPA